MNLAFLERFYTRFLERLIVGLIKATHQHAIKIIIWLCSCFRRRLRNQLDDLLLFLFPFFGFLWCRWAFLILHVIFAASGAPPGLDLVVSTRWGASTILLYIDRGTRLVDDCDPLAVFPALLVPLGDSACHAFHARLNHRRGWISHHGRFHQLMLSCSLQFIWLLALCFCDGERTGNLGVLLINHFL